MCGLAVRMADGLCAGVTHAAVGRTGWPIGSDSTFFDKRTLFEGPKHIFTLSCFSLVTASKYEVFR